MTDLILSQNTTTITMSSLEMVEFINSQRKEGEAELRHDHFMAKVPKVLGESLVPKFLGTSFYVNGAGNKVPRDIYTFPKREACLMAMSYSYDLQAKVFDKMTVLEAEKAAQYQHAINPANWSRMQLIELAMQAEQERLVLEAKVEVLAPKAAIFDRIADADGAMGLQAAAKALQQSPNKFCDWLRKNHWIYRRAGGKNNLGYQDKVQAGYLTHKVTTVNREDGTEKVVEQVLITTKGITRLASVLNT